MPCLNARRAFLSLGEQATLVSMTTANEKDAAEATTIRSKKSVVDIMVQTGRYGLGTGPAGGGRRQVDSGDRV